MHTLSSKPWSLSTTQAVFKEKLQSALEIDLPYTDQTDRGMLRKNPQPAAVLILIGFQDSGPAILYTKRTDTVETHKGQIAFPGGRCEPDELQDSRKAALRETEEEVGIPPKRIQIIGRLPSLSTVTHFVIDPWIGILDAPIAEVELQTNPSEIVDTHWIPLVQLQATETYQLEFISYLGKQYPIHVYAVEKYRIWGATGSMTHNLLSRYSKL